MAHGGGSTSGDALDAFIEACCGSVGAIVSKIVSYPLDLMKTKLAVKEEGETALGLAQALIKERGLSGLYVGLLPKLTKSGVQKFLFFYPYAWMLQLYRDRFGAAPGSVANILIGFFSDFIGAPFVVPIDFVTTQVQTSRTKEGAIAVCQRVLQERGVWGFFDGFSGYVAGSWQPAVQFTFYDQLKVVYLKGSVGGEAMLTAFEAFLLGALAKAFSEMVTYPTEVGACSAIHTCAHPCVPCFVPMLASLVAGAHRAAVAEQPAAQQALAGGAQRRLAGRRVSWPVQGHRAAAGAGYAIDRDHDDGERAGQRHGTPARACSSGRSY